MTRLSIAALLLSGLALSACTNTQATAGGVNVEQAFSSAGVLQSQPYTRTIFSSSNF